MKNMIMKNNKKIKSRSTSALTSLLSAIAIVANITSAYAVTSDSTFTATASVAASCSVSAADMGFSSYTGSSITADSIVSANCSNPTSATISIATGADGETLNSYKLIRQSGSGAVTADVIEVSFAKTSDSTALYSGSGSFTTTGTGSTVSVGTIRGTIAAGQTGKTAGTFEKVITLNIVY
jgi:hypothetical protein